MGTRHVLVVDDDDMQRALVADALVGEGYEVALAASGAEALRAVRARAPDLVVLDLMLPDTDGATVLEEMRSQPGLAGVRVVVTTGVECHDMRRLLRAEAALFKPFGARELLAAVEAALASTGARG